MELIDFNKRIEAVDDEGRTADVEPCAMMIQPDMAFAGRVSGSRHGFDKYGMPLSALCPWRLRNVAQPTPTRTSLEDRMVALVKAMTQDNVFPSLSSMDHYAEARAILAEMEPMVDEDLVEAREIMAELYPDVADKIRNGDWDDNAVRDCLRGIKRGRALALSASPAVTPRTRAQFEEACRV